MNTILRKAKPFWGPALLLIVLTFLHLYPGSVYMAQGKTDIVLSDDTDPAPLTYGYHGLIQTIKNSPERFFYGAVAIDGQSPEGAIPAWYPWIERWLVVIYAPLFPLEQISTAVTFTVIFLSGFLMYLLALFLGWSKTLSMALAMAWAFTPFTRARAKVHPMLAGTYHLPAIFLGLLIVAKGKSWRSITIGAGLFLGAVMVSHYYIVTTAVLSPFFLAFYFLRKEVRKDLKRGAIRLMSATAPAVIFLLLNLMSPVPSDIKIAGNAIPQTGTTKSGEPHPFLYYFSARPIDYIAGDIGIGVKDVNPLRYMINKHLLTNLDKSNPHERANGIRWIVLILMISAIYYFFTKPKLYTSMERKNIVLFGGLAFFSFWLSLSPDWPVKGMGLSAMFHSVVSQIRVPSRAGIIVNFAAIMCAGFFITALIPLAQAKKKKKNGDDEALSKIREKNEAINSLPKFYKWLMVPLALPIIAFVELPPLLQNAPTSKVRPMYQALNQTQCGAGMLFPFTSPTFRLDKHYHFIQTMRKSHCDILNQSFDQQELQSMLQRFAYHPKMFEILKSQPQVMSAQLVRFAQCLPMTWIVFDSAVSVDFMQKTCSALGWTLNKDRSCVANILEQRAEKKPSQCR